MSNLREFFLNFKWTNAVNQQDAIITDSKNEDFRSRVRKYIQYNTKTQCWQYQRWFQIDGPSNYWKSFATTYFWTRALGLEVIWLDGLCSHIHQGSGNKTKSSRVRVQKNHRAQPQTLCGGGWICWCHWQCCVATCELHTFSHLELWSTYAWQSIHAFLPNLDDCHWPLLGVLKAWLILFWTYCHHKGWHENVWTLALGERWNILMKTQNQTLIVII